jgi:hypothetical protein
MIPAFPAETFKGGIVRREVDSNMATFYDQIVCFGDRYPSL